MRGGWTIGIVSLCLAVSACATQDRPAAENRGDKLAAARSASGSHRNHGHLIHLKQTAARDPAQRDLLQAQQKLLAGGAGAQEQAVALYRRAANLGNAVAEYNLGFCHESGLGVPVDVGAAAAWYRRAAANRSDLAVQRLATHSLASLNEPSAVVTQ